MTTINIPGPSLVILCGPAGCGKSTFVHVKVNLKKAIKFKKILLNQHVCVLKTLKKYFIISENFHHRGKSYV